jgi:lysozyme family protein
MADAKTAIDNTLRFEDSTLSGKVTVDRGGRTRFGIAEKYNGDLVPPTFYTTMPATAALIVAESIFAQKYWNRRYSDLESQRVANKLFDMGVNEGPRNAVRSLQRCIDQTGIEQVELDGAIGPATVNAANAEDELALLHAMRMDWQRIKLAEIAANPDDEKYRNGWLRRALA